MMRSLRPAVIAAILAGLAAPGGVRAADEDVPGAVGPPAPVAQEPIARFTIGMLVGTGYGWSKGAGDVNADVQFSGGSRASLGHLIVEGGVLFPRVRLFVLTGPRLQVITGNTDLYTGSVLYPPNALVRAWIYNLDFNLGLAFVLSRRGRPRGARSRAFEAPGAAAFGSRFAACWRNVFLTGKSADRRTLGQ